MPAHVRRRAHRCAGLTLTAHFLLAFPAAQPAAQEPATTTVAPATLTHAVPVSSPAPSGVPPLTTAAPSPTVGALTPAPVIGVVPAATTQHTAPAPSIAARTMPSRPKIGLVLSGGGARGLSHTAC